MSKVEYEIRNNQPNRSDKCEIVIVNPCFNVRFYPTDLVSLNSFTNETEDLIARSKNLNINLNKTADYINKIKNPESEFISSFNYNIDKKINEHNNNGAQAQQNPTPKLKKIPLLHTACSIGDLDQVKKLINEDKHDPVKQDSSGFYPLHYATINNQIDCVKLLLNSFACSPNLTDKNKMTPLHHASSLGYAEIIKLLLDHPDIDLIAKNADGKTCLNICESMNTINSKICADLIKNRMKKPFRQIVVKLMDGSLLNLDLISGSNTTAEQLQQQIYAKLAIDDYHSALFCLWICSKHLKLQLKPDHKPLQHLADWKRFIVQQLSNVDPLKEQPTLTFMRDARCSLKYEKKITNPTAIRLLCFEAYHYYIHSMYPLGDQDTVTLATLFMKIVNDSLNVKQWKDFLLADPKNLKIFVPVKKSLKKPPSDWIRFILIELEKIQTLTNNQHNQTKWQYKFLSHCWTLTIYGSAYFQAVVPINNSKVQPVHVCVNGNGIHLLNKQTRLLELFYTYQEIVGRIHHSPGSIEIYIKKLNQSIFLYTKQYNLINHLMLKLDSQPNI